jgi:hypothetical protein
MPKSRLLTFLIKELREVVPPTVFFAIGFNLVVLTTDLILADYLVRFGSFMVATVTALLWENRCRSRMQCHTCAVLTPLQ